MRTAISSLYLIIFSFTTGHCFSQNLLVNGGFEDENICTEFHVNCSPSGWISTSDAFNNYYKAAGVAHTGHHCVTIEAGNSRKLFKRSYVRTPLLCQLRKGHKYALEFYVRSRQEILDSMGIFFTPYDFLFEKQVLHRIVPSVYLTNASLPPEKTDTVWQKVRVDYTALGTELFLTLGYFAKADVRGDTGIPLLNDFLVFIDDISLTPENANEKICDNWQNTKDDIYGFTARHQYLDAYVRSQIINPPDPHRPGKTIFLKIDTLVLPDVLFDVSQSTLTKKNLYLLDSFATALKERQIDSLVIEGHTDSTGTTAHNERLSTDRATSVAIYINGKMLSGQKIISRGWGSRKPMASNKTAAGRELNRRVEIFTYTSE